MLHLLRRSSDPYERVVRSEGGEVLAVVPGSIRIEMQYLWARTIAHESSIPRSVGLTSQRRRAGVSLVSVGLADAMAEEGSTCLVEANWSGRVLPVPDGSPGMSNLLAGDGTIDDVLIATDQPNLHVLPGGERSDRDDQVRGIAERFEKIVDGLHERFDHVVLDLPALSDSTAALSFISAADASILVARQGVTRNSEIERAIEDMRHTWLLGVVLNASDLSTPSSLRRFLRAA